MFKARPRLDHHHFTSVREKQFAMNGGVREASHAGQDFTVGLQLWTVAIDPSREGLSGFDFVSFKIEDRSSVGFDHDTVEGAGEPHAFQENLEALFSPAFRIEGGSAEDGACFGGLETLANFVLSSGAQALIRTGKGFPEHLKFPGLHFIKPFDLLKEGVNQSAVGARKASTP
jgi:hypothetical protein